MQLEPKPPGTSGIAQQQWCALRYDNTTVKCRPIKPNLPQMRKEDRQALHIGQLPDSQTFDHQIDTVGNPH